MNLSRIRCGPRDLRAPQIAVGHARAYETQETQVTVMVCTEMAGWCAVSRSSAPGAEPRSDQRGQGSEDGGQGIRESGLCVHRDDAVLSATVQSRAIWSQDLVRGPSPSWRKNLKEKFDTTGKI